MKLIRIGVLGCGNVGAPLVSLVSQQQAAIEARTGVRLEIVSVAVRNLSKEREVALPEGVLTRDAMVVVNDPTIDVIVELIGGIEPAREYITTALRNGKPVVTGNKELEIEGRIDKTAGKVQSGFGDAKEKLKDRIDKV